VRKQVGIIHGSCPYELAASNRLYCGGTGYTNRCGSEPRAELSVMHLQSGINASSKRSAFNCTPSGYGRWRRVRGRLAARSTGLNPIGPCHPFGIWIRAFRAFRFTDIYNSDSGKARDETPCAHRDHDRCAAVQRMFGVLGNALVGDDVRWARQTPEAPHG
jgi:hypothetical protein